MPLGKAEGAVLTIQGLVARPHLRAKVTELGLRCGHRLLPVLYLAFGLPVALYLCFLVPPMQSHDENRHFLRACQIARGHFLSQIDSKTGEAGGILPNAESEFVRVKMTPDFLRKEDGLPTLRERLAGLNGEARRQPPFDQLSFAPFPGAAMYPPALYLPQVVGIRLALLFSKKVWILFYSARIVNAIVAVGLIFFALQLAPTHQYLLLIPAVLPMSLYQLSSVSTDSGIIALSLLFVALCIRFLEIDRFPIRVGLFLCLFLLVLGKPIHLPAGLLVLSAYTRLGWRRACLFCGALIATCGGAYAIWFSFAKRLFALAASDFPGRNPEMQIHFLTAHPIAMLKILISTMKNQGWLVLSDVVGYFGLREMALPSWFYIVAFFLALAMIVFIVLNLGKVRRSLAFWACTAGLSVLLAVCVAAYVLWTPPGSPQIVGIQGRYLLPVFALLMFAGPSLIAFRLPSRMLLMSVAAAFFLMGGVWTIRIVDHYYFPRSHLLGTNVHNLNGQQIMRPCPASVDRVIPSWFSFIESGRTTAGDQNYTIVLSDENGTILGESDAIFVGSDRSHWLVNIRAPDRVERITSWIISGRSVCAFGDIEARPRPLPGI